MGKSSGRIEGAYESSGGIEALDPFIARVDDVDVAGGCREPSRCIDRYARRSYELTIAGSFGPERAKRDVLDRCFGGRDADKRTEGCATSGDQPTTMKTLRRSA